MNTLKKLAGVLRSAQRLSQTLSTETKADGRLVFPHDGGTEVRLPETSRSHLIRSEGRGFLNRINHFRQRPEKEALLRQVVYWMLASGQIDRSGTIIDIGCWIGDNATVWAKMVEPHGGSVIAVDPSIENLEFARQVADANKSSNIAFVRAVCSATSGETVYLEGDVSHGSFAYDGEGRQSFQTKTLDDIAGQNIGNISLLHVDVEGFEAEVLRGASEIIERSQPVVIFEQHISSERPNEIAASLADSGYRTFMINEVLPDCRLDCRNFIALPKLADPGALPEIRNDEGEKDNIWYACVGPALIPLN